MEVLAEILLWYIQAFYESGTGLALHHGLSTIQLVCQTWQAVALGQPSLSRFIPTTTKKFVESLLGRSGALLVHICEAPGIAVSEGATIIEARKAVIRHLDRRIQSAQLVVTDELMDPEECPEAFRSVESALRSLVLCYIHPRDDSARFLPNFEFPRLQELCCYRGTVSNFSAMLKAPSLRQLDLLQPRTRLSIRELASLLRNLPLLEELTLQDVFEDVDHMQGLPLSVAWRRNLVTLPNLRRLTVDEEYTDLAMHILNAIVYPATTSLFLQTHALEMESPEAEDELFVALSAKLYGVDMPGSVPSPRTARISFEPDGICSITAWRERLSLEELAREPHRRAPGSFHISLRGGAEPGWLSRLLGHLSLYDIQSLLLSETEVPMVNVVRLPLDVLGALPSLSHVMLEYESFDRVRDCKTGKLRSVPEDTSDVSHLFLGVRVVRVREFYHPTTRPRVIRPSILRALGRAFVSRASAGQPGAQHVEGGEHRSAELVVYRERSDFPVTTPGSRRIPRYHIAQSMLGRPMPNLNFMSY